jgi:hypothetical protein
MSQEKIKALLQELQQELSETSQVDADTLALEARFAANHPVAERLIREVIDTLGRIGI